jgi:hypothetical protein
MVPGTLRAAVVAAAVLAGAAGPSVAKAPSASDAAQSSMDAVLSRLRKEREQDQKTPTAQDAFTLYTNGTTPLGEFKPLTDCINESRRELKERDRAATAILDRFKAEAARRAVDPKFDVRAFEQARNQVLRAVGDLMLKDDPEGRRQVHRLTTALLDPPLVWKPDDQPRKRQQAHAELKKRTQ